MSYTRYAACSVGYRALSKESHIGFTIGYMDNKITLGYYKREAHKVYQTSKYRAIPGAASSMN